MHYKPIPISTCHHCDPLQWRVEKTPSVGYYTCQHCNARIQSVLVKKDIHQQTAEKMFNKEVNYEVENSTQIYQSQPV